MIYHYSLNIHTNHVFCPLAYEFYGKICELRSELVGITGQKSHDLHFFIKIRNYPNRDRLVGKRQTPGGEMPSLSYLFLRLLCYYKLNEIVWGVISFCNFL